MAPGNIIVDIVFIPIYALLTIGSVFNALKHRKTGGFIQLCIFALLRLVGTILLVYAYYSKTTNTSVYTVGALFTGLGYSFLVTAVLSQFQRATVEKTSGLTVRGRAMTPVNFLRLVSTVALILLIAGYSSYNGFANPSSAGNDPLPTSAKVGDILFIAVTIGETALLLYSYLKRGSELKNGGDDESLFIVRVLLGAQPFLLVRIIYSTHLVFSSDFLNGNPWARLVCINICECIAAGLLMLIGFKVAREQPKVDDDKEEEARRVEEPAAQMPPHYPPTSYGNTESYKP